jgi:hypothetical protein
MNLTDMSPDILAHTYTDADMASHASQIIRQFDLGDNNSAALRIMIASINCIAPVSPQLAIYRKIIDETFQLPPAFATGTFHPSLLNISTSIDKRVRMMVNKAVSTGAITVPQGKLVSYFESHLLTRRPSFMTVSGFGGVPRFNMPLEEFRENSAKRGMRDREVGHLSLVTYNMGPAPLYLSYEEGECAVEHAPEDGPLGKRRFVGGVVAKEICTVMIPPGHCAVHDADIPIEIHSGTCRLGCMMIICVVRVADDAVPMLLSKGAEMEETVMRPPQGEMTLMNAHSGPEYRQKWYDMVIAYGNLKRKFDDFTSQLHAIEPHLVRVPPR